MSAIFGLTAYVLAIYDSQLVKLECGHARSNLPAFFFADSFQSAPTSASYNENKLNYHLRQRALLRGLMWKSFES
jgi:hypothetical protein